MTATRAARLAVTIRARQRLSMGRGTGSAFHTPTHEHVPGSVLRGAIAKAWLHRYGNLDNTFREVFDDQVRFGPAFAAGSDVRPLSVQACKYGPGHCDPWYADTAYLPLPEHARDKHWTGGRGEVTTAAEAGLPVTAVTTTAIRHTTGTAADGQLFSRSAIETGTVLHGHIIGPADALRALADAVTELDRVELGGRSSVLGSAEVTVSEHPEPAPPAGTRLSVHLLSPAILVDDAGRPTLNLARAVHEAAGLAGTVRDAWVRPLLDGTGGFHAASGLPKPADVALAPGSTLAVDAAAGDAERLITLAAEGIGLRRPEGFGWIRVSDRPWTYPTPTDTPGPAGAADAGYAEVVATVTGLRLDSEQRRWLTARLTEPLWDAAAIEEALAQPRAHDLSGHQRAILSEVLALPLPLRRHLADQLREGDPR